jgi:hypothetical protein
VKTVVRQHDYGYVGMPRHAEAVQFWVFAIELLGNIG